MRVIQKYLLLVLLTSFFVYYTSYGQFKRQLGNKTLFVKIAAGKSHAFFNTLCSNQGNLWNSAKKFCSFFAVRKASLLGNDSRMGRWLSVSFRLTGDSAKFINALKGEAFVKYVQSPPGQLMLCSPVKQWASSAESAGAANIPWYIKHTHLPALWGLPKKRNIIIAIVDDGVRMTHKDIADRIWTNSAEIPGNNKDDDGDGFIDDVHGWDVSDDDNDVTPPVYRLQDFYHGTHIAGEIALATPAQPGDKFRIDIMPVKCLSDNAKLTYLKDGYRGIEYAIKAGANIINCSWGGGNFSQYEKDLLQTAFEKNILIVASAGNYPTEQVQYPAGGNNVIAVTGIDSNNIKPHNFNYGPFITVCAPGVDIEGASVMDDSTRLLMTGTSEATPIVTSIAALIMAGYPGLKVKDIQTILMNSALPVDDINAEYNGKLGAGLIDAAAAVNFITQKQVQGSPAAVANAKGYLLYARANRQPFKNQQWYIHPYGHYRGIRMYMPPSYSNTKGSISVYKTSIADTNLLNKYSLQQLPDSVFAAEDSLWVVLEAEKLPKNFDLSIAYRAETVDSSCLYCSGTKIFTEPTGTFSDGSGNNPYAGREDCRWLIEAPEGKKITLQFTSFNTQARVDFVYVFDGDKTNGKIIALYSGPNIPPPVTSFHNKMLVWFVTNETMHGNGWTAKYTIH